MRFFDFVLCLASGGSMCGMRCLLFWRCDVSIWEICLFFFKGMLGNCVFLMLRMCCCGFLVWEIVDLMFLCSLKIEWIEL